MPLSLQTFAQWTEADEALQKPGARFLAGGTLLARSVNEGDVAFHTLVRSTDAAMAAITVDDKNITIGAAATMSRVAQHPALQAIAKAARAVGGPAIRNMATVGGNLFAPAPYGDFAVALLALDATVLFGNRAVPISYFFKKRDSETRMVTAVRIAQSREASLRFLKVSRVKPKGISVVTIAAVFEKDPSGIIRNAHIALGCMADRPIRAMRAEQALLGKTLSETGIAAAINVIGDNTTPITDSVASSWYRSAVLPVHLRRLLLS